jgi:hypothetical protein
MGTHTYYTHRQARLLLNIDGKTLNKWLEAAHIEVQPDPKDTRFKRITRTQLQRLATLHSIELPDDEDALLDDLSHARSLNVLTLEVERLEQSLEEHFVQMQRTLMEGMEQRLARESERILVELGTMLQEQVPKNIAEQVSTLLESAQKEIQLFLQEQMTVISQHMVPKPEEASVLEAEETDLTRETAERPERRKRPPSVSLSLHSPPTRQKTSPSSGGRRHYERPSNQTEKALSQDNHTWTADELFEEGWTDPVEGRLVSRARMCKAHSIPETNVRRDMEKFHLFEMVDQRFLFQGAWKTGGFNAAQRRRVWEEYHERSWFNPCEICLANQHLEE